MLNSACFHANSSLLCNVKHVLPPRLRDVYESNGFVERSVQTVKSSFVKAVEIVRSLQAAVQAIRSTPVGGGLPSPTVLLQSRNLRGNLPFVPKALKHQDIKSGEVGKL